MGWWWLVPHGGRCHGCGRRVPDGRGMAYDHAERRALCRVCWEREGVNPQPARSWRKPGRSFPRRRPPLA